VPSASVFKRHSPCHFIIAENERIFRASLSPAEALPIFVRRAQFDAESGVAQSFRGATALHGSFTIQAM